MDELELVRRFYGEGRLEDIAARDRALGRLRDTRPIRRFHRIAALVAAAALALVTVVAIPWYAGLRPDGAAASELERLAGIAGGRELAAGGRPVVYERYDALQPRAYELLGSGESFTIHVRARVEIWRGPDGSQRSETEVLATDFASERDRELWEEVGRPTTPAPGPEEPQTAAPGAIHFPDLGALPREPAALLDRLREGWGPAPIDDEEELLLAIGELLVRGDAEPALRRSLFEAAATLDGVELLGSRPDPLGRTGIAIGLGPEERRIVLIVDPETSFLLSIDERRSAGGSFRSWRAYTAWATVGTLGVRPDASDLS